MDGGSSQDSTTPNTANTMTSDASTRNTSSDMAWEWGTKKDPTLGHHVLCKSCDKRMCRGLTRLKEHLMGCPNVTAVIKKRVLASMSEDEDDDQEDDIRVVDVEYTNYIAKGKKRKGVNDVQGPLDTMFKPNYEKMKQVTLNKNDPIKEKLKMNAWKKFAIWAYSVGLPLNAVQDESFQDVINAIGEYGRGMPAPSYHNIRVTLMKDVLADTRKFMDSFRPHWKKYHCSIMCDLWTDGKGRCLINFLVNCPVGTVFLKSIDASEHVKDAQLIVRMINDVIEDVGKENIVQFVTDNGSNFKAAGKILEEQHPKLFWTPCAAHSVNLMLGDIGEKIPKIKHVLAEARAVVVYIYNHGRILNMLRKLMKNKELHRSCVTRFATQFHTLRSIFENRHHIQVLFVSEQWAKSDFAKKACGKRIARIVAKSDFWDNVFLACQVMAPLVDVVRLVDAGERPCMGYIYDAMDKAKEQIKKNLIGTPHERLITSVWAMIQARWSDLLHHPLHAAGYYLNPAIYYGPNTDLIERNREIKTGLYVAIDRLVPNEEENDKLRLELDHYIDVKGQFGSAAAIRNRAKVAPYIWWRSYGIDTPLLQQFAIRVLSQICSASPCERNWSAFDNLHSKKRNLLLQQKLNDLVFIQYNTRLERRFKSLRNNKSQDPILLRDFEENDDWVIPTEVELQEFVDASDGFLWSDVREAMGGNVNVGPNTRRKRERYRDDEDDEYLFGVGHEEEEQGDSYDGIIEALDLLNDVDSDAEPVDCS